MHSCPFEFSCIPLHSCVLLRGLLAFLFDLTFLRIVAHFCALAFPAKQCVCCKTTCLLSYWSCCDPNSWELDLLEATDHTGAGMVWLAMSRVYKNLLHVSSTHKYTAKERQRYATYTLRREIRKQDPRLVCHSAQGPRFLATSSG